MRLNKPAVWAPLISLALVLWFVWSRTRVVSPGPLSAAHAQDSAISEEDCEICHGDDSSDHAGMAAACAKCHTEIERQIAAKQGLHGRRISEIARCGACHSEHNGPQFQLTSKASFERAGIREIARYDHEGLGFELAGKHLGLACLKCHENADAPLLEKGKRRYIGKTQQCASCHKDPHEGRLPDCKSCHGEERPFPEAPLFEHTKRFPLAEAHADLACAKCHEKSGPTSIEATGEAQRRGSLLVRACAACHESPHAEGFLAAATSALKLERGNSCERCHPLASKTFKREGARFEKGWHAYSGFALVPPHAKQECVECHKEGLAYKEAHPARTPGNCAACHADVHQGQFGARACLDCHALEAWKPALYDVAAHRKSAFALEDKHATTKCNDCHLESDGVRRYAATRRECVACHVNVHGEAFAAARGCQDCHAADDFAAAERSFDHLKWTGFAVDNAHERAGCASCHKKLLEPEPGTARTFGRVEVHPPATAAQCVNCHADAHRGFFKASKDCDECHGTELFEKTKEPFDHLARTAFALVGAHQTRECTICHLPAPAKDANGRRFGFSKADAATAARACTSCHTDVHANGFKEPSKNCLDCHTQVAWTDGNESFDHLRWTGFELVDRHAEAGCRSCHPPLVTQQPSGRRSARAFGRECASCHQDVHVGQFVVNGVNACTRCHTGAKDFHATVFDHQRDSRFHIDATHEHVACAGCHVRMPLKAGGTAVRYKPLGIRCSDCHSAGG